MSDTDRAAIAEAVAFGIPHYLDPEFFRALSHPTRCVLLELLANGASRPTDLGKQLTNVYGLWHHLNKLREMGIIKVRRVTQKRTVYYIHTELLRKVVQQLTDIADRATTAQHREDGEADDGLRHELEEALEA